MVTGLVFVESLMETEELAFTQVLDMLSLNIWTRIVWWWWGEPSHSGMIKGISNSWIWSFLLRNTVQPLNIRSNETLSLYLHQTMENKTSLFILHRYSWNIYSPRTILWIFLLWPGSLWPLEHPESVFSYSFCPSTMWINFQFTAKNWNISTTVISTD